MGKKFRVVLQGNDVNIVYADKLDSREAFKIAKEYNETEADKFDIEHTATVMVDTFIPHNGLYINN